jgi:glyoxylase-like metal-dependent hydrolase (beta-lactamase superfamily II)
MFVLDRRSFMAITGAGLGAAAAAGRAGAAVGKATVFTADAAGALVDSTVILGEKKALLVDAQFDVANATRLADIIAATGRELETIWITHAHPDHLLGLAVLMDRFPGAKPLTHAAIRPRMEQSAQGTLDFLTGMSPGVFASRVVLPDAATADHLTLEGERIDIIGPLQGDTALVSALHIPVLDTLVAADFVYADTFVWTEEATKPEAIEAWRKSLDLLEGIGAGVIVPGHRQETSANDATGIAQTRAYLAQWEAALASAKSAEDLRAAMLAGNDKLGFGYALDRAVAAVFPG